MTRTVEVALVPVFQFGVFSDGDLAFFAGPNLDFAGRVHTNGDLFLLAGGGSTVTFHDKVTAWGNVIRWELPNGITAATSNHLGSVDILTTAQGCDGVKPNCRDMGADTVNLTDEGSVLPGRPSTWTTGGQNTAWPNISQAGAITTLDYRWKLWKPGRHGSQKTVSALHQHHPGSWDHNRSRLKSSGGLRREKSLPRLWAHRDSTTKLRFVCSLPIRPPTSVRAALQMQTMFA